jgi:hypothetical protein
MVHAKGVLQGKKVLWVNRTSVFFFLRGSYNFLHIILQTIIKIQRCSSVSFCQINVKVYFFITNN